MKTPAACTEAERAAFARLVRQGFPLAARLEQRVRDAHRLAFRYAGQNEVAGVAALKSPSAAHRAAVFRNAAASAAADDYPLELGTVRVFPGADHAFRLPPGPSGWPVTAPGYVAALLGWLADR